MPSTKSIVIMLLAATLLSGCLRADEALPCQSDRQCLRYGLVADIPVLDPHYADSHESGIVLRQMYDTLVYRDADTRAFLPGLASRWEVSPDGLAYTFELRRDISFHDGSRFDAEAVARNIERIYLPDMPPSLARALLGPLYSYEIVDEYVIRLQLSSPYAPLLDGLSQPYLGMASPAVFSDFAGLRYQFHQSGTGPFALEAYTPGERIALRRFSDYKVNPGLGAPPASGGIERVEFLVVQAEDMDPLSLLRETVDVIDDVSPVDAQSLAGNSRVQILPTAIPGTAVHFLFNSNREHLNNPNVRRALLLATNRVAISDRVYYNFSPAAWAPLSASTGYAHTGYVNVFGFDPEAAANLLAASGYSDSDGDGILERAGLPLELRMVMPPWHEFPAIASYLRQQWGAIGVELITEPVPGRSRLAGLVQSGEYDLLPVEVYGLDPIALDAVFGAESTFRASLAPHPELTERLELAAREQNMDARRNQYYEIQALLMNDTLLLPLREAVRITAARARVRDLKFDAYGFYPLLHQTKLAEG